MLSLVTDDFEIITADIDERAAEIRMEEEGVPANKVSERLAEIKAEAVFDSLTEEEKDKFIVIGADTSVILDDVIYGKPEDREDVVRMLSSMSGRAHVVATGVALFTRSSKRVFTEETRVEFNALDDYQKTLISEYCDSRSSMNAVISTFFFITLSFIKMDLCDFDFSCRRSIFCEILNSKQGRFDLAIIQKISTTISYNIFFILLSWGGQRY